MSNSIHSDTQNTMRVGARRFEMSPFHACYANADTVMGVYAGRYYPVYNGEDVTETYWALRRKAALYDVPERPVEISGPDVDAFLEHVFARRVSTMKVGRGRYAIALTPDGGVFMDGILFKLAQGRYWYVQPDGALETWLAAHKGGFDVTVSDPHAWVLQIQGPPSLEVMKAVSDGAIDEEMGYFRSGFFDLGGQEHYVSRTGWTSERGYEIYFQGDAADAARLWAHLMEKGAPYGLVFSSISSMDIRRIEAGILDNGTDFDMTMSPYEAGLGAFVDLDKGPFVGREALEGAAVGTRLYGVKSTAGDPAYRGAVFEGGAPVGHVTAAAHSPYLEAGIGYVRFDGAGDWAGKSLTMEAESGGTVACEIVELPFYDKEKRIPRGLETEVP